MDEPGKTVLRLDKWLWFCRFYKTRALATSAVRGGHVRLNGERVKPGARVSTGDRVFVVRQQLEYDLSVVLLPERRGAAPEMAKCYEEDAESVRRREVLLAQIRLDRRQMPMTAGRPDKHTRKALRSRKLRGDS